MAGDERTSIVSPDTTRPDRLPPGQTKAKKFPVLTFGAVPNIDRAHWRLTAFGRVAEERSWTWDEFLALGQVDVRADFHCVTTWSYLDNLWTGVPAQALVEASHIQSDVRFVLVHCYGGYTTNMALEVFKQEDCVFAHRHNGVALEAGHGGPLRLVVPRRYGWKSAKWVSGVEFLDSDRPGYWEQNGYSNSGDPWLEERYG